MKKIVFFSKNLKIGGMEKALVSLLNSLSSKYDITLILEEKTGILLDELNLRITVEEYTVSHSRNILFRKIYNLSKRLLWKMKNKNRYDFSCNYATYSVIGSRLAQIASANSAYYIHSDYYSIYNGSKEDLDLFFGPHYISKYKNLIFVSNESKNNFLTLYPSYSSKTHVINNLISYDSVISSSNEIVDTAMNKDDFNLLFVGRLENQSKNFDLLIESFKLVVERDRRYKLYIIGDGDYRGIIENLIIKNGLESNILLLGEKKNPYPFMKACDAIIFTSNYEGFPVTFLEALVLKKRLLTTVVMSDETVDMRQYVIVLKRDASSIADDIIKNVNGETSLFSVKLDFRELNMKKLGMLIDLIEV